MTNKVLILFHSRGGNTAKMADFIAAGANAVAETEVRIRTTEQCLSASRGQTNNKTRAASLGSILLNGLPCLCMASRTYIRRTTQQEKAPVRIRLGC